MASAAFLFIIGLYIGLYSVIAFISKAEITENQYATSKIQFLVTNTSEIWLLEQNKVKYRYPTNSTAIADVDYHIGKNILIWIDAQRHEIHLQSLIINSTDPPVVFNQLQEWRPVALSVDFIGNKLYVADVLGQKIDVFQLNGQYHGIVIGTDLVQPLDVKLDPYEGLLFILDGFRVVRASMDGSSPASVILRGITILHGLSIDFVAKKIYWSRGTDFQMMFSNYTGNEVGTLGKNSSLQRMRSKFTTFNGSIFWAEHIADYKSKCRYEEKEKHQKPMYQSMSLPTIKVLHASLQLSVSNPCDNDNGGCQQMCVLRTSATEYENNKPNITYKCACNVGWILAENSKNCTPAKDFLIYVHPNIMKSHLIENCTSSFCEPYLPVAGNRDVFQDFDYQYDNNYLYYIKIAPLKYDTIYKVQPNNSAPKVFLLGKNENYQSLAIDYITLNLYFTDSKKGTVNVINTRNSSQKTVILENLELPEDIVVHANKGFVYFFQTNANTKTTIFSKANVDGSNLTAFFNVPLTKHCGFTIDFMEDTIYWFEWRNKYIQFSNLNMDEVRKLETPLTKYLYTIAVHDRWIYVAGTISQGVWRFNKKNTKQSELILPDFTNRISKVKIFSSKSLKINSEHPCIINNGGCFEFCFGLTQNKTGTWAKVCANSTENICKNKNKCLSPQ